MAPLEYIAFQHNVPDRLFHFPMDWWGWGRRQVSEPVELLAYLHAADWCRLTCWFGRWWRPFLLK